MPISDNTIKLLWGRAAGVCSNPECRADLTVMIDRGHSFNVGEMAHVIAKSPDGPRGKGHAGSDEYPNLILLCPTCHRKVDKAPPGVYLAELLHAWKADHENAIRLNGKNLVFRSSQELKTFVARTLADNKAIWRDLGPRSATATTDPGSNLHEVWTLRKLNTIVPNNTRIVNAIEGNISLLTPGQAEAFRDFKSHASAFERHQYRRLDHYPEFPVHFEALMQP
jgi:hypothetical protein